MTVTIQPYDDKNIAIQFTGSFTLTALNAVRNVPGRSYKPDKKLWTIPDSQSSVKALLENLYQTNEFTTEEKENSTAGFTQGKIGQGITSSQELQKLKEILLTRHYRPRTIENYLF